MTAPLPRLHAMTDDRVCARADLVERAEALALAAGASLCVHLRTRVLEAGPLTVLAQRLRAALGPHGAWLAVSGRADVARAASAQVVALGRGALSVADVRRVHPGAVVGVSVHDDAPTRGRAEAPEGDFVIAGPVFETASHPDVRPAGLDFVRRCVGASMRPVIAIGGMTPARAPEVIAAGACGVAAIRALWDADDPATTAGAFLEALPVDATVGVTINGESRRARRGITLAALLGDLGLDPRAVVVEHNRGIVRRGSLEAISVGEGDAIEVVHFVGGG